jgi:hypothetical protein
MLVTGEWWAGCGRLGDEDIQDHPRLGPVGQAHSGTRAAARAPGVAWRERMSGPRSVESDRCRLAPGGNPVMLGWEGNR